MSRRRSEDINFWPSSIQEGDNMSVRPKAVFERKMTCRHIFCSPMSVEIIWKRSKDCWVSATMLKTDLSVAVKARKCTLSEPTSTHRKVLNTTANMAEFTQDKWMTECSAQFQHRSEDSVHSTITYQSKFLFYSMITFCKHFNQGYTSDTHTLTF